MEHLAVESDRLGCHRRPFKKLDAWQGQLCSAAFAEQSTTVAFMISQSFRIPRFREYVSDFEAIR